jgi:hypothetical protein
VARLIATQVGRFYTGSMRCAATFKSGHAQGNGAGRKHSYSPEPQWDCSPARRLARRHQHMWDMGSSVRRQVCDARRQRRGPWIAVWIVLWWDE